LERLPPVVYETVVQTLIQIKEVLERATDVGSRYGLRQMPPARPILERAESATLAEIQRQGTMITKVQKSCSIFLRIIWTAYDRGRFVSLVEQLEKYIDALYDFCPVRSRQQLTYAVEANMLARTILDEGQEGVQMMQRAAKYERNPSLQGVAGLAAERDRGLELQSLENGATQRNQSYWQHQLNVQQIEVFSRETDMPFVRSFGALRDGHQTPVMIEWRTYNPLTLENMSKEDLQNRVEALARLLGPRSRTNGFRILECKGYFEDNTNARFGLVFSHPPNVNNTRAVKPISLYQIIRQKDKVPLLGDRFALAGFLAESLHRILAAGWLHKSVNAHNLLFFRDSSTDLHSGSGQPVSLGDPYFTGFALARPNGTDVATSRRVPANVGLALYRHPDVMGINGAGIAQYQGVHDIYSLGIILLEIGTWVRIEQRYIQGTPPQTFRDQLISAAVPQLGPSMGENYMRAVRKCLTGSFGGLARLVGDEPDYNINLLDSFCLEVIDVIKNCQV
jgi:hypothetical protein